jgi:hypothetical protein
MSHSSRKAVFGLVRPGSESYYCARELRLSQVPDPVLPPLILLSRLCGQGIRIKIGAIRTCIWNGGPYGTMGDGMILIELNTWTDL